MNKYNPTGIAELFQQPINHLENKINGREKTFEAMENNFRNESIIPFVYIFVKTISRCKKLRGKSERNFSFKEYSTKVIINVS